MKFCQSHWQALRSAVRERGMEHLVAKSGEDAHAAMVRQVKGEPEERDDFDPLMSATWMIYGRFIETVGLEAMQGEKCPLCECREGYRQAGTCDNGDEIWIAGCTDSLLEEARERNLVPRQQ
jgi:hypothetical protein